MKGEYFVRYWPSKTDFERFNNLFIMFLSENEARKFVKEQNPYAWDIWEDNKLIAAGEKNK